VSFILDALRKSEIERQRQSGPSMAEFPVAREDRRLPVALVVIGAVLPVARRHGGTAPRHAARCDGRGAARPASGDAALAG
jgi:hypothetical protein